MPFLKQATCCLVRDLEPLRRQTSSLPLRKVCVLTTFASPQDRVWPHAVHSPLARKILLPGSTVLWRMGSYQFTLAPHAPSGPTIATR